MVKLKQEDVNYVKCLITHWVTTFAMDVDPLPLIVFTYDYVIPTIILPFSPMKTSALSASFELARANVDEIIEIEDQVMAEMMLEMRDRLNLFVEPACAASLGAAVGPLRSEIVGKKIGVLACGSNISANRFAHYTQSL